MDEFLLVSKFFFQHLLALGKLIAVLIQSSDLLVGVSGSFGGQLNFLLFNWQKVLQLFDILFALQVFISDLPVSLLSLDNRILELLDHDNQVLLLMGLFTYELVPLDVSNTGVTQLVL